MQEPKLSRKSNFVRNTVKVLVKRFNDKLQETMPTICEETILRESNIKGINAAMDRVEEAHREIDDAKATYKAIVAEFHEMYGVANINLMRAAKEKRKASLIKQKEDFEFDIRYAIGLVELVDSAQAYDVLQQARIKIRDLGKQ